jgi:glycosyltransferase involved in cell wall biosynthesis
MTAVSGVSLTSAQATTQDLVLSIFTTALNEAGNVVPFLSAAQRAIGTLNVAAEIVYIDDGSTDGTGDRVLEFSLQHPETNIRLVRHEQCRGITAAVQESIEVCRGEFICFIPADMESDPAEDVPKLFAAMDADTDVVVGWRKGRDDGKLFASRVYNKLNEFLFDVRLHDANWIRIVRRSKMQGIQLRSDWHRFVVPILAHRGCRFKEVETRWQQRQYGRSNFGLKRFPVSLADMLTLKFLLSYGDRPMLFFLWVAASSALLSVLLTGSAFLTDGSATRSFVLLISTGVGAAVTAVASIGFGLVGELLLGWRGTRH